MFVVLPRLPDICFLGDLLAALTAQHSSIRTTHGQQQCSRERQTTQLQYTVHNSPFTKKSVLDFFPDFPVVKSRRLEGCIFFAKFDDCESATGLAYFCGVAPRPQANTHLYGSYAQSNATEKDKRHGYTRHRSLRRFSSRRLDIHTCMHASSRRMGHCCQIRTTSYGAFLRRSSAITGIRTAHACAHHLDRRQTF